MSLYTLYNMANSLPHNIFCDDASVLKTSQKLSHNLFFSNELSENLEKSISTLNYHEKVSLVFLLEEDVATCLRILHEMSHSNPIRPFLEWCRSMKECNKIGWEISLMESFVLIQNYNAITQIGFSKFDIINFLKFINTYKSVKVNPIKKLLFELCENLSTDEANVIIQSIEGEIEYDDNSVFTPEFLEAYILEWVSSSRIKIEKPVNIDILLELLGHLKKDLLLKKLRDCVDFVNNGAPQNKPESEIGKQISEHKKTIDKSYYEIKDEENVGICIIVNQLKFTSPATNQVPLPARSGSEVDCKKLEESMSKLKIKTFTLENLNSDKIIPSIRKEVDEKFEETHSVLFVVILSHGVTGCVYGADCVTVSIEKIKGSLLIPAVNGKPKVMIIQACQGNYFYELSHDGPLTNEIAYDGISPNDIVRCVSDLLVCTATVPGFKAIRHIKEGSWYIQALCDMLDKFPQEDFYSILTKVNRKLQSDPVPLFDKKVAMLSTFDSTFSRLLYLSPRRTSSNET